MNTTMFKRYLCLAVVLLFLIPTVTALNVGNNVSQSNENETNSDEVFEIPNEEFEIQVEKDVVAPDFIPHDRVSIEVQNILNKYSMEELTDEHIEFLIDFNKRMLDRYDQMLVENPRMPYEPMDDITGRIAQVDPETGEVSNFFPNTPLNKIEPRMCDRNNYQPSKILSDSPNTVYTDVPADTETTKTSSSSNSGSRSSRAPAEADIELVRLEWDYAQEGWAEQNEIETDSDQNPVPGNQYALGGFQVGKTTTFTATVRNNNPSAGNVKIWVNFSIYEWYTGIPMDKVPTSNQKTVGSSPITVDYEFTPKFAGTLLIQCLVEYINDPDTSNNYVGWVGIPVIIWSADLEGSGTNYGWQKLADGTVKQNQASDWTGDKGATDAWHVTDGPTNQNAPSHTTENAWFHGEDVGGQLVDDRYADDENRNIDSRGRNHTYLQTPYINMGDILDTDQVVEGIDVANSYYTDYQVMFACLITGEYEEETEAGGAPIWMETDWADVMEHNDANNDDWFTEPIMGISVRGDYSTMSSILTTPRPISWNPNGHVVTDGTNFYFANGYPMRVFISDGNGGINTRSGQVTNWTNPGVRFRVDYSGDGEDDNTGITGCYYDDFITWGIQEYTPAKRVGISEMTYPKTGDVSILYKDSSSSFTVTVENFGKQHQFNVVMKVAKYDDPENIITSYTQQKSAGNLAQDEEKDIQFSFTPDEEGDYIIYIEAGDLESDWTPSDNEEDFIVHVSPVTTDDDVDVLLVDDDNSEGQGGIWRVNTEFYMMDALTDNDMKFRVYTVEYNESGPVADVMDDYELVIWSTGLDNQVWVHGGRSNYARNNKAWDVTLKTGTDEDIDQLEQYLSGKDHKLWLISPGLPFDIHHDVEAHIASDFPKFYLHIDTWSANQTELDDDGDITAQGTPSSLEGVPDTIMDDVDYDTYIAPDVPFGFTDIGGYCEKDKYDDDASVLFYQDDAHQQHNAIIYIGKDHMAAYFAFDFYLIADEEDRKDCVYRILTGFKLTGGVLIQPFDNGEKVKTVYPGETTSFRFKVTNTGKKTDIMKFTWQITYSSSYPTQYKNWQTYMEIDGVESSQVSIDGLKFKNKVYLYVTAPDVDEYDKYPLVGETVKFTVKAESQNTKLDNSTAVLARIPAIGNITLEYETNSKTEIEIDEKAEFQLILENKTNGNDDVTVQLSFSGDGSELAQFVVSRQPTTQKKLTRILSPNDPDDDVELHIIPAEHTLTGWHNVTVTLMDEIGDVTYGTVELSVKVKQFYQVEVQTTGDENGISNFVIDPNNYTGQGLEEITKVFTINVLNYGNGMDTISLDWEKNDESDDISSWTTPRIYEKESDDDIEEINVGYYDVTRKDPAGVEKVYFEVYIPIDIKVGIYKLDFMIESSGTEKIGEDDNNVVSFSFRIIKPNLVYTKLDNRTDPNFEFYDFEEGVLIEEDLQYGDYYIEEKHSDFDLLTLEIKVFVINSGATEVELDPKKVWLNITYIDQDGYDAYPIDANLTPDTPTSDVLMPMHQKVTFTFRWDPDTLANKEPTTYTFTITVDGNDNIYETDETDNSASFELTIKHIPKPKKDTGSGGMPGFDGLLMVTAIAAVVSLIVIDRRRRKRY